MPTTIMEGGREDEEEEEREGWEERRRDLRVMTVRYFVRGSRSRTSKAPRAIVTDQEWGRRRRVEAASTITRAKGWACEARREKEPSFRERERRVRVKCGGMVACAKVLVYSRVASSKA